jgi:hypothetical protein
MFFRIIKQPFGAAAIRRRYIKDINKHTYIQYNKDNPDLTKENMFDMFGGFLCLIVIKFLGKKYYVRNKVFGN